VQDILTRQVDPYPYGWRYIQTTTTEGVIESSRVVLTRYDLLHPKEDDVVPQRTSHTENAINISTIISTHLSRNPEAFVFSRLRTDLNLPNIEPIGPDISVFFVL